MPATVDSTTVRSKSSVWSCTVPSASMMAVMPEIAACTTGRPVSAARICPIATCWAEFADAGTTGCSSTRRARRRRRARVAEPGSRTPTRSRSASRSGEPATSKSPGSLPAGEVARHLVDLADELLEQLSGTARPRRTARGGAWRRCPAIDPSGREEHVEVRAPSCPSGRRRRSALASTHAWCLRATAARRSGERVGPRVAVHARLGEHDQVDRVRDLPGELEVAPRQVAITLLGRGEVAVLVVALHERDAQVTRDRRVGVRGRDADDDDAR